MMHRVLFSLLNEQADAEDPPTVKILHIRHGSQHSLTRREIREIEAGD